MPPKKGGQTGNQRATTGYLRNKLQSGDPGSLAKKMDQLMARIPRGTFASVGGALGGPAGAMAGRGLSAITGYGDYTVKANSLSNSTMIGEMADQVPVFRQQGADIRVKHCEFVTDLVVPSNRETFTSHTFDIDPTSTTTFPWLASVAEKYQKFKVKGMVVGYRSTSTDYNNSGVVAIAVNYDAAETPYASMTDMLNSKFAVSSKPSNSMLAPVECDPSRSPLDGYYVKHVTSTDTTEAAIRQTVMGKINVATSGLTLNSGATIGQIYVSYDIEFLYPYMHTVTPAPGPGPAPVPSSFRSGSICTGLSTASQSAMNTGITSYGTGSIVGWTNPSGTTPITDVMVKYLDQPSAATFWFSIVMPPGRYRVNTLDSGVYTATGDYYLLGTSVPATFGSAITVSTNQEYNYGTISGGKYVIDVAAGTEAARTWHPNMQISRAMAAVPPVSALSIAFQEF